MKICFLMDSVNALGGAQKCTITLANELIKKNNVTIICTDNIPESKRVYHQIDENIKIVYIKWYSTINSILNIWTRLFKLINNNTNLLLKKKKLLTYIYYKKSNKKIKELQKYIDDNKFDCIVGVGAIHTMILSLLKKNNNEKFIGWQHSTTERYFRLKGQFLWHQDCIFKDALKNLDNYVVLTDFDKLKIKEYFNFNAIKISNSLSFECSMNINESRKKIILAVGRYNKVKGYDMLIRAFEIFSKTNQDYILRIVGDGPERNNLQELATKLNLQEKIQLSGMSNNVIDEYMKADFFALSSLVEGFPMVLLEAMECGLPIVTFDLPCVHEILNDQCGYIVEYMNIEALADAMLKLADVQDKKNIRNACHEQASKFKVKNIIKEWEKIL